MRERTGSVWGGADDSGVDGQVVQMTREWTLIGVPSSAGAHHAGQERAPAALRKAGLPERLRRAGLSLDDAGDLPETPFSLDDTDPTRRNLAAVVRVAERVADAVAEVAGSGRVPLVLGGDCTITLGALAGYRRHAADIGLVYVDADADVNTPSTTGSGIFDSMGVAHMLGEGAPELAGLAGTVPLIDPRRLTLLGCDPREVDPGPRQFLAARGVSIQDSADLIADPAGAASRALSLIGDASGPVLVHFDVDLVDSGDLPLGNFPHYGTGVLFDRAVECLHALRKHPSFGGLVLTEVNPTHDADGRLVERYVAGIVAALTRSLD